MENKIEIAGSKYVGKQRGRYTVRKVGDGRKAGKPSIINQTKDMDFVKDQLFAKLIQPTSKPTWANVRKVIFDKLGEDYSVAVLKKQANRLQMEQLLKRTNIAKKFDKAVYLQKRLGQMAEIVDITHTAAKETYELGKKFGMHTKESRGWNYAYVNVSKAEREALVSAGLLEDHSYDKLAINVKGSSGLESNTMKQINNAIELSQEMGSKIEDERKLAKRNKERETKIMIEKRKVADRDINEDYDGSII